MQRLFCVLMLSVFVFFFALSQVPPDRDGLLKGEGMGQAKYAEMNGYPGPKHVLELADKLRLTESERKSIQAIHDEMSTRAKDLGQRIVDVEEELNNAYKEGLVSEKSVRDDAEQIGRLRGKLRAVHLKAHLKTKKILTQAQIDLYKKLRQSDVPHQHN